MRGGMCVSFLFFFCDFCFALESLDTERERERERRGAQEPLCSAALPAAGA